MTLLQDFDYLGRARGRAAQETLDSLDTLDSLAHTATALLTASVRHRTQAGTGHVGYTRDLKVPCVEEDSGYQTSENEAENEDWKENGSGSLDLGYGRRQGPVRQSSGYHGVEILDLSCQRGENGVVTDGSDDILHSAYATRRERRITQPFSHHEVEILNLPHRREDGTEGHSDLEQERKKQKHIRLPFDVNGGELLYLQHEIRKRETNRDSLSDDRQHTSLANGRREHERLRNILTNKREYLNAGVESIKRELDSLSVESETVDSGRRGIKRRRTERTISDEGEDVSSLGDEEQEERTKRRTGDSIHGEVGDILSSGYERTERRRTGDDTREEFEKILSPGDDGKVVKAAKWDSARERTKRTGDLIHDQVVDVFRSGHERTKRRETGDDTREDFEDILSPEDEGEEEKAAKWDSARERKTEDSVRDSDDDNLNPDDVDEIKPEPGTEEAVDNPLAATSTHSQLHCCNNGFFRTTGGVPSVFESNCGCTTHNLVDWRTRVTWTNPKLFHQVRVREVTVLSPFRTSAIPWGHPVSPWRSCPTPQSSPQPQHPLPLPQTPQTPVLAAQPSASALQLPLRVKEEQVEDDKSVEGDRGYRCGQVGCGRTFCRNEELTRHLRIHSGQRPFVCQRCGRRFVRRDHLTKHQRTHLPAHVKRSYTCPLPACTHRYTRSDALTRHMWTAHHLRARQPTRGRREAREEPPRDPKT